MSASLEVESGVARALVDFICEMQERRLEDLATPRTHIHI